jgi:hypothetical protein
MMVLAKSVPSAEQIGQAQKFSLSPREARVGGEPERGAIQEELLLPGPLLPPALGREEEDRTSQRLQGAKRGKESGDSLLRPKRRRVCP